MTVLGENIFQENNHRILGRICDLRTIIERKNSNEVVGYNRSEMPTRGINWARCFVSISNITALLAALTAYKVGRFDLIRAASAFIRFAAAEPSKEKNCRVKVINRFW